MEDAVTKIENRQVAFDVAVIDTDLLGRLVNKGQLAEIDFRNVPT